MLAYFRDSFPPASEREARMDYLDHLAGFALGRMCWISWNVELFHPSPSKQVPATKSATPEREGFIGSPGVPVACSLPPIQRPRWDEHSVMKP